MTALLVLLGAALCSLTMSTEVVPQADFNLQTARGKWYLIGFATDNQRFINIKNTMTMGVATLERTPQGYVELSYAGLSTNGSCWRRSTLAKETGIPGKRQNDRHDVIMVGVKNSNYALVYDVKTKLKVPKVVQLYGRRDEVCAEVKEKFRQFALDAGILAENIVFLPKNAK